MTERERLNKITETIIGAAIQVHRVLGPGLLESAYIRHVWPTNWEREDLSSNSKNPFRSFMKRLSSNVVTGWICCWNDLWL
jgi:hypothetical protein